MRQQEQQKALCCLLSEAVDFVLPADEAAEGFVLPADEAAVGVGCGEKTSQPSSVIKSKSPH